jgi:hypothetical protein
MLASPRNLCHALCGLVLGLAAAVPAWTQVTITPRTSHLNAVVKGAGAVVEVRSEHTCGFIAAHADGLRRAWYWSIDETGGGTFMSSQGRPGIQYRAPRVVHGTPVFHIRATDPGGGGSAVFAIVVLPSPNTLGARALQALDVLVQPQTMGPHAAVHGTVVPAAEPFAGTLPGAELREDAPNPPEFWHGGIRFMTDPAPAMKDLNGRWLAWGHDRIMVMRAPSAYARLELHGQLTPTMPFADAERFPMVDISALNVLPVGGSSPGRWHMVAMLHGYTAPFDGNFLCGIDPDGTVWPIAGRPGPYAFTPTGPAEGPGASIAFSNIAGIALDRQGNILVTETRGLIRQVSEMGVVTILAGAQLPPNIGYYGSVPPRDGHGAEARFAELGPCALDPDTGDLYVADNRNLIRRVSRDGTVTTLLGGPNRYGGPWPARPALPASIPEDVWCMERVYGLDFDAGILYIADGDDLLAFNPRDRFLYYVMRSSLSGMPRFGPLAAFSPTVPAAACAAFDGFNKVAVRNGVGLVSVTNRFGPGRDRPLGGVVRFTLPPGAFGGRAAAAALPEGKEDKRGPAAAPAATPAAGSTAPPAAAAAAAQP